MIFTKTELKDLYIIEVEPNIDERGLFFRTFCKKEFLEMGLDKEFVQINQSINHKIGTFRGLHFQRPPYGDTKLIRCISGKVYDVLVDVRKDSETFLKYVGLELSEENKKMLFVPEGFAHGFITLEDNSQLIYHHTTIYKPGFEDGVNYNDPKLELKLPIDIRVISQKDLNIPLIDNQFKGV